MQSNCDNEHQELNTRDIPDTIKHEHILNTKKEIDMLCEIEINKAFVNFYTTEKDTSQEATIMLEIAMDTLTIRQITQDTLMKNYHASMTD